MDGRRYSNADYAGLPGSSTPAHQFGGTASPKDVPPSREVETQQSEKRFPGNGSKLPVGRDHVRSMGRSVNATMSSESPLYRVSLTSTQLEEIRLPVAISHACTRVGVTAGTATLQIARLSPALVG